MFKNLFKKRKKPCRCTIIPAPKVMQVNIDFEFAKIYNIQNRVDVVLGQKFSLYTDSETPIFWFANGDPVLAITERDTSADLEATALGKSVLLIMDSNLTQLRRFDINVVNEIVEQAKNLNATADQPVLKA